MGAKNHAHKFKRHRFKTGNEVYFCVLPDCQVKIKPALTLGKRAICWRCGNEFQMTDYSVRLAKPHCNSCHQPKEKEFIPSTPPPQQIGEIINLRERLNRAMTTDNTVDDDDI